MNELESKQIKFGILWLPLGVFLIPTLNGVESIFHGILKLIGLSITNRLVALLIFDSIIILALLILIILILRNGIRRYAIFFDLPLKKFRLYGLVCLMIIIAGRVVSYFILTDIANEMKLLESNKMYDLLDEATYYQLASSIITAAREILLFIVFFAATMKKWR